MAKSTLALSALAVIAAGGVLMALIGSFTAPFNQEVSRSTTGWAWILIGITVTILVAPVVLKARR